MKKILILIGLLIPMFAFAENTCEVINDTSTGNIRNLTCDSKLQTVTKYKTDDINPLEDENEICKITCTEEVIFAFDPIKKVMAGMGFSYPLRVSGTRKCSATYDYLKYEKDIRDLVNNYENATGDAKETAKNEIVNYYDKKQICDEFNYGNKNSNDEEKKEKNKNIYTFSGNVAAKIQYNDSKSNAEKIIKYQFVEEEKKVVNEDLDEVFYDSCDLDISTYSCNESPKTIRSWKSTSIIIGKYTMPYTYVEKYTGETFPTPSENTCNAKDKFFTETSALTKPAVQNSPTDNGYEIVIGHIDENGFKEYAIDLGNNLEKNKEWKLGIKCYYQVGNYIFPQKEDPNFDTSGFMYRLININDPFPDRDPNANWYEEEDIILSTKDILSTLEKFTINLNRNNIKTIQKYNNNNNNFYDTFELNEMEKSNFIENNREIINRK